MPETFSFANQTLDSSDIEQMIDGTIVTSDDNPILINYIKKQMNPPASNDNPLNLAKPIHTGQVMLLEN